MRNAFNILIILFLFACNSNPVDEYLGIPKSEIETTVIRHLNDWYPLVVDTIDGGYYTNFEFDWTQSDDQQKMLVTQTRDLWTASKAAQHFPENKHFIEAANHGYKYLTTTLWDSIEGGFLLYYKPEAKDSYNSYKLIYSNSFALFALAEYAKINPSEEVYKWITTTINWMDSVSHDNIYGGYYNIVLSRKPKENTPENKKEIERIGWGNSTWKDQNTSIHLLEAFTTAYEVLPTENIKKHLEEMLILVRDTMTQENGSLKLYFTSDWQAIDNSDSSRTYILENSETDHVSFGHNIETAYLLIDASKKLYGNVDSTTLSIAKKLTDHTLKFGFGTNYYGLYDKGFVFNGEMEIINKQKTWWSQAEAMHTLALMTQYFPEEKKYQLAFQNMWQYMEKELYDHKYGGYFNNGIDESPMNKGYRKAHNWKGPYHDGRALMMVWEYSNNK